MRICVNICRLVSSFPCFFLGGSRRVSAYLQASEWRSLTNQSAPQGKRCQFSGCLVLVYRGHFCLKHLGKTTGIVGELLLVYQPFFMEKLGDHIIYWMKTSAETQTRRPFTNLVPARPKLCKPNKMVDWIDRLLVVGAPESAFFGGFIQISGIGVATEVLRSACIFGVVRLVTTGDAGWVRPSFW